MIQDNQNDITIKIDYSLAYARPILLIVDNLKKK